MGQGDQNGDDDQVTQVIDSDMMVTYHALTHLVSKSSVEEIKRVLGGYSSPQPEHVGNLHIRMTRKMRA